MFSSPAYAQTAAPAGAPSGSTAFLLQVGPLLFIFVIFYFLLIRPQQRRAKSHQAMIAAVKKGDTVVTAGGLVGRVTRVDEAELEVEIAANTRVKVVKGTLAEVRDVTIKKASND